MPKSLKVGLLSLGAFVVLGTQAQAFTVSPTYVDTDTTPITVTHGDWTDRAYYVFEPQPTGNCFAGGAPDEGFGNCGYDSVDGTYSLSEWIRINPSGAPVRGLWKYILVDTSIGNCDALTQSQCLNSPAFLDVVMVQYGNTFSAYFGAQSAIDASNDIGSMMIDVTPYVLAILAGLLLLGWGVRKFKEHVSGDPFGGSAKLHDLDDRFRKMGKRMKL